MHTPGTRITQNMTDRRIMSEDMTDPTVNRSRRHQ
jgi:hypothetical protein